MRSRATADFWVLYRQLPKRIQRRAKKAYRLFTVDPHHPSLRYHTVTVTKTGEELHSVSVTRFTTARWLMRKTGLWSGSGSAITRSMMRFSPAGDPFGPDRARRRLMALGEWKDHHSK